MSRLSRREEEENKGIGHDIAMEVNDEMRDPRQAVPKIDHADFDQNTATQTETVSAPSPSHPSPYLSSLPPHFTRDSPILIPLLTPTHLTTSNPPPLSLAPSLNSPTILSLTLVPSPSNVSLQ